MRNAIAAQLVRDKPIRRPLLLFEQLTNKPCGCSTVAPSLPQDIENVAVLVDGAPQILTSALDLQEDLVQQPVVARGRPLAPHVAGVVRPESATPPSNCFVAYSGPTRRK